MTTRIKTVAQTDETTTLRVLVTPFGDSKNLDLHGEYFDKGTDFGDDVIYPVKTAFYEHGFNTESNPHMEVSRQVVGHAKFVEQDEWGRWYEFELKRSLEYHDYVMKLVDLGLMGGSSGCFPGMKRMDASNPGRIKMWYEAEPSLTPTPAHPITIGSIEEQKTGAERFNQINSLVKSFKLSHLFKELILESDADSSATSDADTEGKESAEQNDAEIGIDKEVEQILNGGTGEKPESSDGDENVDGFNANLDEVAKAISDLVLPRIEASVESMLKANWDLYINLWSYDDNETPEDAIRQLLGMGKSYESTQTRNRKAMTALAKSIASFSPEKVLNEMKNMSDQEQEAFNNLTDTTRIKSAIPENAPGG